MYDLIFDKDINFFEKQLNVTKMETLRLSHFIQVCEH